MRATRGASNTITSSGAIPLGKLTVDAWGDDSGVPWAGVPGRVPGPSLRLLLGSTIGNEYRNFNALQTCRL